MSDSFNNNTNLFSPLPKKQTIFNTYNVNKYRSIDSISNRPLNRPLNNKSENDITPSSISSYNFQVEDGLFSKYNFNKNEDNTQNDNNINLKNKDSYINYLKNKLLDIYKTNKDLNKEFMKISQKSKTLKSNININNTMFEKIKNDYENELKKNNELKQQCKNFLENYKNETLMKNKPENFDIYEIDKLKKEQKMLLLTTKSKEDIISNLQKTLNILKNEIGESKNYNLNNKNNIDDLKQKRMEINNKNNFFLNNFNEEFNESINKTIKSVSDKNDSIKNIEEYANFFELPKTNVNLKLNSDNRNYNKLKSRERLNDLKDKSFDIPELFLNNSDKKNNDSQITKKNKNKNILMKKNKNELEINQYKKKNQLLEYTDNNQLILNNKEEINPIINYTISNTKEEINLNKNILKRDQVKDNKIKEIENKNTSYLFSITKEGKILEFNLLKKEYKFIDTSKIIDWNIFILEYLNNYEGSLLLNTFQGLFILTGEYYSDLYYFSKKYNTISKINSFKYNHKYGGLILSPDNNSLLLIGGETKNIEILNFESSSISELPPLLYQRINSSFTFIGDLLFAFFGKNNNTIEFLNMEKCQRFEIINYKINFHMIRNFYLEGHTCIPINRNEILIIGGEKNYNNMIFNFYEKSIDIADIEVPFIEKVGEYIFDKDKYFNVYMEEDKSELDESSISQLIGMDSKGNIHYFNNNFVYSIILFEN